MRKYAKDWEQLPITINVENSSELCTIIVAFRNERDNLPRLVEAMNKQKLPFEQWNVLFIDDHSTDSGASIIQEANPSFHFSIQNLPDSLQGKKAALQYAQNFLKTTIAVHTDADCHFSELWLQTIVAQFYDPKVRFVSAPVIFENDKSFLEALVQLEFAALIAMGAAHIYNQEPLICNGANLAYRRDSLSALDIYSSQKASGDDTFLMEYIHHKYPQSVVFCKNYDALVYTKGPSDIRSFISQRVRWASKNGEYKNKKNVALLVLVWFFYLTLFINLISLKSILLVTALFSLVVKISVEAYFYEKILPFFRIKYRYSLSFLGQGFQILYMIFVPVVSQLVAYQWKGRKTK